MIRHLLDLHDFDRETWQRLIQDSINFSSTATPPLLDYSRQSAFLFLEPSTRTQLSFGLAAQKLGINVHHLYSEGSSLIKGESLLDTLLNLEAMGFNSTVIRLKEENLLTQIRSHLKTMSLICAGEGKTSHPSQALLDACTIYEHFQRLDNLKVLFLGDTENSRVFSSNLSWLKLYNNTIFSLSPKKNQLIKINDNSVLSGPWDDYLDNFDVIIMLRPQLERYDHDQQTDLTNYHQNFGITAERFRKLSPNAILLHPGPFYRNIEFSQELLSEKSFKIYRQVYWGVLARMSIFNYVLGK